MIKSQLTIDGDYKKLSIKDNATIGAKSFNSGGLVVSVAKDGGNPTALSIEIDNELVEIDLLLLLEEIKLVASHLLD
jgi:hypothetical protein